GTVSFDVQVTNKTDYDLRVPVLLVLDPSKYFQGTAVGAPLRDDGLWMLDIGAGMPNGVFRPGASTLVRTVTLTNPQGQHVTLGNGVYAMAYPNTAPVFSSVPVTSTAAGSAYQYQAAATDPDGSAVTYVLLDGPQGSTLNSATGLLTWSPTSVSKAEQSIVLRAYDTRGGFATQAFMIEVAGGDRAPTIDLPPTIRMREGQALSLALGAFEPDGQALSFLADNLPPGARFDSQRAVFEWTPSFADAGEYRDVRFSVSDGTHFVTHAVTFIVEQVNAAPVLLGIPDRTVRQGDPIRFQLRAEDVDGDEIVFASPDMPAGASLNPNTGVFEWTPPFDLAGDFAIHFRASDGKSYGERLVHLNVINANAAPVFVSSYAGLNILEGETITFSTFAFDPDNPDFIAPDRITDSGELTPLQGSDPTVNYTVLGLPQGAVFDADTAMFTWTPSFTQAGNFTLSFTATDTGDGTGLPLSSTVSVPIVVRNANRPPVAPELNNIEVAKGRVLDIPISVTDADGNVLDIKFDVTLRGLLQDVAFNGLPLREDGRPPLFDFRPTGNGTGVLRVAPLDRDRGDYIVTLIARDDGDGGGEKAVLSASRTFVVKVTSNAEPPLLNPVGPKVAVIGQSLQFTIQASDQDQDALQFSTQNLPAGATLVPGVVYGTAIFTWTPTAADAGTRSVSVTVTDAQGGSDTRSFDLIARVSNAAPILLPVGDRTVAENALLDIQLAATDADGDVLTWSAANLPPGAVLDTVAGRLRWQTNFFSAGTYSNVRLTVSDGAASSNETIRVTVTPTNQAPLLATMPPLGTQEQRLLQFSLVATDPDGDALTYAPIGNLPQGAEFDVSNGRFTWIPGYDQAGEYTLGFITRDASGAQDSVNVKVSVADVNRLPVLAFTNHQVALGDTLQFSVSTNDPDSGEILQLAARNLPQGANFNPVTGQFRWAPGPGQVGDYLIAISATDGKDVVERGLALRVNPQAIGPQVSIVLTPSFPSVPGQPVAINVLADAFSAVAGRTLTINGAPLVLDATNRAFFTAPASGIYKLVATATDLDGYTTTTTENLRVRDPLDQSAPAVNLDLALGGQRITTPIAVTGSVVDGNLERWTLDIAPAGSERFETLASGSGAISGTLATLDPTRFDQGFYQLRLTATDIAGRSGEAITEFELAAATSTGRYLRTSTDFTATLGGKTLDFIRRYDSFNAFSEGSFGAGWELVWRDLRVGTDVPRTGSEASGVYNPLRQGSRVILDTPDGGRAGFTFAPRQITGQGFSYFLPEWVPDAGVTWKLESASMPLQRAAGKFYSLDDGSAYNPASLFGERAQYTLIDTAGTRWAINAADGLTSVIYSDGVRLLVGDSGIVGPGNEGIVFSNDAQGRIKGVTAPDGRSFGYGYDDSGNLNSARNLSAGTSERYGYADPARHRLTLASGPAGGQSIAYGTTVTTRTITADLGAALSYLSRPFAGTLGAGVEDLYSLAVRPSEVNLPQGGAFLLGVTVSGDPGSGLTPALPVIEGLNPVVTRVQGQTAFAMYRIDAAALHTLRIAGAGSGAYTFNLFAAGDVNADSRVDGIDAAALSAARGSTVGQASYVAAADLDRDGDVDAGDSQLLFANLGFSPNLGPSIGAGSGFTHVELETVINVSSFLTDPEGDALSFRILSAEHGIARLSGDGTRVLFRPNDGFSGAASFVVQADDGYTLSAPGTVSVTVSNAPLTSLDFVAREPRIGIGGSLQLELIGDFADQQDVLLPASYLTFSSTNPDSGRVGTNGRVAGLARGEGALVATRGNILAATAFLVGKPATLSDTALALSGLDVYPGAVTVVPNGGERNIVLSALGKDVASATSGTRYFASNSDFIEITADGRILGRAPGEAIVTVIHKMLESRIAVKVDAPRTGTVSIGSEGGVVQGDGGLLVAVAPGAFDTPTQVSITQADPATFGLPMLPANLGWNFGAAFHLDLEGKSMAVPAQLAISTPTLAAGTQVVFYRVIDVPNPDGSVTRGWLETESGVVGADGIARTSSPPYAGAIGSGDYAVLGLTPGAIVRANITLEDLAELSFGLFAAAQALRPLMSMSPVFGTFIYAAATAAATYVLSMPVAPQFVTVTALTPDGKVYKSTPQGVDVREGTNLLVSANIIGSYDPDSTRPQILPVSGEPAAEVKFENVGLGPEPILTLRGQKFLYAPAAAPQIAGRQLGTDKQDLSVVFRSEGKIVATAPVLDAIGGSSGDTLKARVPQSVALGTVTFEVKRIGYKLVTDFDGTPVWLPFVAESSEPIRLDPEARYIFGAVGGGDKVLAIAQEDGSGYLANELVARIGVGDPQSRVAVLDSSGNPVLDANGNPTFRFDSGAVNNVPRAVAATGDNTRAYVTLRGRPGTGEGVGLAVIDALTLQQIDAVPDVPGQAATQGVQFISVPADARPFWLALDESQGLAFVGDEGYEPGPGIPNTGGRIHVIDIDPSSETYHKYLGSLQIMLGSTKMAPIGLRGMTMGTDGQLLLTAPGVWEPGAVRNTLEPPGRIIFSDVRNMRQQLAASNFNLAIEQVLQVGPEPYNISTTSDKDRLIFTMRGFDGDKSPTGGNRMGGVGLLQRSAGSRAWDLPDFIPLTLGSAVDALDVNNAQAVVITKDLKYAFVSAFNKYIQGVPSRDPDLSKTNPAGGNVGIIRDPFGIHAGMSGPKGLVAATRMLPYSFPDNLVLSNDGKTLWVAYGGITQAQAYDVDALIKQVEDTLALPLPAVPPGAPPRPRISETHAINNYIFDAAGPVYFSLNPAAGLPIIDAATGLPLTNGFGAILYRAPSGELLQTGNSLIDIKADYRLPLNAQVKVFANFDPARAPIDAGILFRGMAAQNQVVKLLGPAPNALESSNKPTFTWSVNTNDTPTTLYVSTSREALFPKTVPSAVPGTDGFAHRILTKEFAAGTAGATQTFQLPDELVLTRENVYWWGVEAKTADGRVFREVRSFEVDQVPATHYASVEVLIDGFDLPYTSLVAETRTGVNGNRMREFADRIAEASSGLILSQEGSEDWVIAGGPAASQPTPYDAAKGGSIVLLPDWGNEAVISDSGFAEAAADRIFASIVALLKDPAYGAAFKQSNWHFVGFSRGAAVASEVIQRLGKYFPPGTSGAVAQIKLTTLDSGSPQTVNIEDTLDTLSTVSPAVGNLFDGYVQALVEYNAATGELYVPYGDLRDPAVRTWSNILFHDNYYGGRPGATSLPESDLELNLANRAGFGSNGVIPGTSSDWFRTLSWYVGTQDLGMENFALDPFANFSSDLVWRSPFDAGYQVKTRLLPEGTPQWDAFNAYLGGYSSTPWYRARDMEPTGGASGLNFSGNVPVWDVNDPISLGSFNPANDTAPWEGIGQGWYYAPAGGGSSSAFLTAPGFTRTNTSKDNTAFGGWDGPVPTIFNGNFQASLRPILGRFMPTGPDADLDPWFDLPGWSTADFAQDRFQATQLIPEFRSAGLGELRDRLARAMASGGGAAITADIARVTNAVSAYAREFFKAYPSILADANFKGANPTASYTRFVADAMGFLLYEGSPPELVADVDLNKVVAGLTTPGSLTALHKVLKEIEPDLTPGLVNGSVPLFAMAMVQLIQEHFANWSYQLDNSDPAGASNQLTHSALYVPEGVSSLNFRLRAGDATGVLHVRALVDGFGTANPPGSIVLGPIVDIKDIDLSTLPSDGWVDFRLAVPTAMHGKVVNLQFEAVLSGAESVRLDEIRFEGLTVTETSGVANDRTVLFLDDTDPAANPTYDKVFQAGKNIHSVTIENTTADMMFLKAELEGNFFLVGVDAAGVETAYNDGNDVVLSGIAALNPFSSRTFTFKAELDLNKVFTGPTPYTAQNFIYDQWLMGTTLKFTQYAADLTTTLAQADVEMSYLADIGDRDADDGVLTFSNTREGTTRVLRILNDTEIDLEIGTANANRFQAVIDLGSGIPKDTFDYNIEFIAKAGGDAAPVESTLELKLDGQKLGEVGLRGKATRTQEFTIDLTQIRNAIADFLTQYAVFEQSGSASALATYDANPTGTLGGVTKSLLYSDFKSVMTLGFLDKNLDDFVRGVEGSITSVYQGFVGSSFIPNQGYFGGSLNLKTANTAGFSSLLFAQSTDAVLGRGSLDLEYKELFGPAGALDAQSFSNPVDPLTLPWSADDRLSPVSVTHRVDSVMNRNSSNQMTIYLANNIADFSRIKTSLTLSASTLAENYGRWMGVTIAHELAHTLGLLDEYFGGVPSTSFMSAANPFVNAGGLIEVPVGDFHKALFAAAFDDPAASDKWWGLTTGAADRAHQYGTVLGVLLTLEVINVPGAFPKLPGESGAATGNGDLPPGPNDLVATMDALSFALASPTPPADTWAIRGSASMSDTGTGTLIEDASSQSGLARLFTVPQNARGLSFTILDADFTSSGQGPQDAFEVALLDLVTGDSLLGSIGLGNTDASLNVQNDGTFYAAQRIRFDGLSGTVFPQDVTSPIAVTIDFAGLNLANGIALYFDLLGFGALGSRVVIDDVRFLFEGDNQPPVAQADSVTTAEDTPLTFDPRSNDTDPEGSALSVLIASAPAHGSAVVLADGRMTYTPNANYFGPDSFTYRVSDGALESGPATVSINVTPANDPPVTTPVTLTAIAEDSGARVITQAELLANASDIDGDVLTATGLVIISGAGTLTSNNDGTWSYTSALNDDTQVAFGYSVTDGVATVSGSATLDITPVNDAPVVQNLALSTLEDTPVLGALLISDVDSTVLSIQALSQPAHGTLALNADGSFVYTPNANYFGPDSFGFQVTDGVSFSGPGNVAITVTPVNDAPVAVNATISTNEDTSVLIDLRANASDIDSLVLTPAIVTGPQHGVLTSNVDGTYTYTPAGNYFGADAFTYRIRDEELESGVATVTINVTPVNDAPVAADDAYSVDEDAVLVVTVPGLLANDQDVEAGVLSGVLVNGPAHGSLIFNADGSFSYTPNANYFGPDSFTYRAKDGELDSNLATVSITVNPVNDPPTSGTVTLAAIAEDSGARTITQAELLENATDIDGDVLTATGLVITSGAGTLTNNNNGTWTYTPALNDDTQVAFGYSVTDGVATVSGSATLDITPVNDAPVVQNLALSTPEDTPVPGALLISDVDSTVLSIQVLSQPAHGTLALNADGTFVYTPNANYFGPDNFGYQVTDGISFSGPASVSITVTPVNDAPVAGNATRTTAEDTPLVIDLRASASDIDSLTLTPEIVTGPQHGTLTVNADGTWTYAPAANYFGADSFTYRVRDEELESGIGTITIDVTPVNDAPVAGDDAYFVDEDAVLIVAAPGLLVNDQDVEASLLTSALANGPMHGSLIFNADGSFIYTPNANYFGPDSFTYRAKDGELDSNVATVTIGIRPVNDPPVTAPVTLAAIAEDSGARVITQAELLANASDIDGDVLTATGLVITSGVGTLTNNNNGTWTYTPALNDDTQIVFGYSVTDGVATVSGSATLDITPVNDAPSAGNDAVVMDEDGSVLIDVLSNDSDVEGDALTIVAINQPAHGSVVIESGKLRYTPNANYFGPDSFTYRAKDGELDSNLATVSITVNPVNDPPTSGT
ncbi:MAG: tandem-95 repeat protein, partial [Burkholderiales bacterium]